MENESIRSPVGSYAAYDGSIMSVGYGITQLSHEMSGGPISLNRPRTSPTGPSEKLLAQLRSVGPGRILFGSTTIRRRKSPTRIPSIQTCPHRVRSCDEIVDDVDGCWTWSLKLQLSWFQKQINKELLFPRIRQLTWQMWTGQDQRQYAHVQPHRHARRYPHANSRKLAGTGG